MITIDLDNVTEERVGRTHGIAMERELPAWSPVLERTVQGLLERRRDPAAMLGWIDLPGQDLEPYRALGGELEGMSDLVVLGIGGSSLGAMTVISALQHPYRALQANGEGLRVHFVDNVDPDTVHALTQVLDPQTTLVNVISKSGTTAETMAAYLLFKEWLERALGEGHAGRIIATTDPEKGILRPLANRRGYRSFSVPPSVGGRFSVFSAVGLLPISLAGIDVEGLLNGAAWANEAVRAPLPENPVAQAALVQYLNYRRGKSISVLMPYSSRLRALGDWFVQLWAESLGKAVDLKGSRVNEGSTPLGALGATDQHSQVQLFNEGPNDKLIAFVRLAEFGRTLEVPDSEPELEELSYLAGSSFNRLIGAEQSATAFALAHNERPNYTLQIPELNAQTLGALLQFLMWQTALMGELLNIDTYNQPGVELGKIYTYALLGREGFEEEREELRRNGVS